jgi:hypothetical protein
MGVQVPDQQPTQQGGPSRGLLIVGFVALSIAIAGVAFGIGRLTAPTKEAEGAPSTTTTIVIEAVGETLDWSEGADIGKTWPVGLVEHDGTVYFFGSPDVPFGPTVPEGSGLDAWASADGTGWNSLGTVISAPALVQSVAGGGAIYSLGIFGAFVYYWQQADTFWQYVLSFIQGLFWPAWMVYEVLAALRA